ncbi:hypothetical protein [Romboutsia sp. 13368]|uniref:hypothetical protein n=1 Tax=Romboutsia sp. 13368 TaxID=2708053 RepID=UPI0025DCE2A5|nr:hypothetical protein [Romboutsia sp. 13368]
MNKRKTIYRGFNKRRKNKMLKMYIIGTTIFIICGYGYTQLKDSKIFNNIKNKITAIEFKIPFINSDKSQDEKNNLEVFDYEDVSKDVDKVESEENTDVNVATIKGWNIYTVQVASVEDKNEISKVEEELTKESIPFSTIEIDGLNKVQTYTSFDKESVRSYLENMRTLYPDAFLAEVKIPALSLEYTSKYTYLETISTQLNKLIENFEEESKVWEDSTDNFNMEMYNNILSSRKTIVKDIEEEAKQIDYEEANVFKENLIAYVNNIDKNIEVASKSANEQSYNISQGIYLNTLQGYLSFINSIQ